MKIRIDKFKVRKLMGKLDGVNTLKDLAVVAGLGENTVNRSLDSYSWKSQTLTALAVALDCDPRSLLTIDIEDASDTQQLAPISIMPAMAMAQ